MNRFNYYSGIITAAVILTVMTGCGHHVSPTEAPEVKVDIQVIGADSQASGSQAVYSGTVESDNETQVSFPIGGTITNIYVDDGQRVTRGQVVAEVKTGSLDDQRGIAQAELDQVRDLYDRLKTLHDQNALPDVKWVEVQAKLKQAEDAVALADKALDDATITSPITGYVAEKLADVGQSVLPSQPVARIVGIDKLQVSIPVPENEINRFGDSVTAHIVFATLDGLTVDGLLASKSVVADPLTRTYDVKFDIPNGGGRILPGMIGDVTVTGLETGQSQADFDGVWVVPAQSVLLNSDNRQFVWLANGGKAERRYVTANELRPGGVAVDSGLVRGDSLIVAGMQKVSTGTKVTNR